MRLGVIVEVVILGAHAHMSRSLRGETWGALLGSFACKADCPNLGPAQSQWQERNSGMPLIKVLGWVRPLCRSQWDII